MIAISEATRRTMYAKSGTVTVSTYSSSDTSGTYIVVVPDNGWREVTVDDLETIEIKEPAQEQDEPDTGERPVYWKRPQRRPANGVDSEPRRRPWQVASTYG